MQTSLDSSSLEHPSTETPFPRRLSSRGLKIQNNPRRNTSIYTQRPGERRNSSPQLKLWTEDYYDSSDDDNSGEKSFAPGHPIHSIAKSANLQPLPSTAEEAEEETKEEKLSPRPVEETIPPKPPVRKHARSLTSLLSFRNSISRSPERKLSYSFGDNACPEIVEVEPYMPSFTGDKAGGIKVADRSKPGISSWFSGSSAPLSVGIPALTPDRSSELISPTTMSFGEASPDRSKLKKRPSLPTPDLNPTPFTTTSSTNMSATTTTSRFGSFFSKVPPKHTVQLPAAQAESDPLLADLLSALYPSIDGEAFSPAAYKNLQMTAEGTILRLQTAYKIQLAAVYEIAAERDAIREEKEEADLKAQCLQGKIDALNLQDKEKTKQITGQESVIQNLVAELAFERRARAEEKETREKSVALVKAQVEHHSENEQIIRSANDNLSIDTTTEDLGISTARRNRDSSNSEMSLGIESDIESPGASIFSRSRSPTLTMNSTTASSMRSSLGGTGEPTLELHQTTFARVVPNPSANPTANTPVLLPRPKTVQQKSTFQKLLSGMAGAEEGSTVDVGAKGCSNCSGSSSSVAWDTVGLMRAENMGLKERIGELEEGLDSALDILRSGLPELG